MKRGRGATSVAVVVLAFSGCVTFDHTVTLAPLENECPISASSSYRDEGGFTIAPDEYEILKHFSVQQDAVLPLVERGVPVVVDFNTGINDILRKTEADAVVNLHYRLLSADTGDEKRVRISRELGEWTLGIGILFIGIALVQQPQVTNATWAGGIITGTGLLELLVSWEIQRNGKTTMKLSAEGDVVRFLE